MKVHRTLLFKIDRLNHGLDSLGLRATFLVRSDAGGSLNCLRSNAGRCWILSILRSNSVQLVTLNMLTSKYRFDVKIYTTQLIETKLFLTSGGV